jgi:hypothetical protein
LFVLGAAGEMGFVLGIGAGRFARFGFIFLLVPFLLFLDPVLFYSFGVWSVEEVRDGSLHASKVRWVGTRVYCSFDLVKGVS